MTIVAFTVPGLPVPKKRPKVTTVNGYARAYTPKETKEYERDVSWTAKANCKRKFEGLVVVTLRFFGVEADWDNLAKAVCDGMNGIVYNDDRQIVEAHVYVTRRAHPARVEVEVRPIAEAS